MAPAIAGILWLFMFNEADVTSAKLKSLVGADNSNLERAYNLKSAFRD